MRFSQKRNKLAQFQIKVEEKILKNVKNYAVVDR